MRAERSLESIAGVRAPIHANALAIMALAARRLDVMGRNMQIATEARSYYDDARANADGKHDDVVERDLNITKYLLWEQRDMMLDLVPLVKRAWEYENRPSHELSVLERYHIAAQLAIERADKFALVASKYAAGNPLPSFDEVLTEGR